MINKKIIEAVSKVLPTKDIAFLKYIGLSETYCVFNYVDDIGSGFADDEPEYNQISVQVHVFTKDVTKYKNLRNGIRKELNKAGFTYPVITELYEKDTEFYHIVFETNYLESEE